MSVHTTHNTSPYSTPGDVRQTPSGACCAAMYGAGAVGVKVSVPQSCLGRPSQFSIPSSFRNVERAISRQTDRGQARHPGESTRILGLPGLRAGLETSCQSLHPWMRGPSSWLAYALISSDLRKHPGRPWWREGGQPVVVGGVVHRPDDANRRPANIIASAARRPYGHEGVPVLDGFHLRQPAVRRAHHRPSNGICCRILALRCISVWLCSELRMAGSNVPRCLSSRHQLLRAWRDLPQERPAAR